MSTILFFVHPMAGSVNASLKTARELKSIGHQVCFLGLSRCEKFVRPNGFDFIPLFEKWFPKDDQGVIGETPLSFWQQISRAKQYTNHIKTFIAALVAGEDKEFFKVIGELKPDMIIVVATHYDSFIWGMLAYKAGIKTMYLHDTLCGQQSIKVPPITTDIIPDDSIMSRFKIALEWKKFLLVRFIKEFFYSSVLGTKLGASYGVVKLCKHYQYPLRLIDTSTDMLAPKLKLTEIVLCPKEFDFPGAERIGRYYVGASIDLDREQSVFSWERIDVNKPLIYCALGSLECLNIQDRIIFFQVVIDTAKQYKEWCWIIAIGEQLDVKQFNEMPSNIVLVNRAPQLSILKKADIMITHGGTNTIKECIWFGVPMIVFPLEFDHYGNAARVVYQGLGLKGNIKKLNVSILTFMIEQIYKNPYYRIQIKLMKKKFEEVEKLTTGNSIINIICS
ncbi:MAG: glycosyltransferase [Methylobacter sp.]